MDVFFLAIVLPFLVWPFARWARCNARRERGLRVVFVLHVVGFVACWFLPSFFEGTDDCAAEPFLLLLGITSLLASGVVVALTRGPALRRVPREARR